MNKSVFLSVFLVVVLGGALIAWASEAGVAGKQPVYAFCGVGDNLWNYEVEPVDSPATIEAMFEWMGQTYHIGRMYWREERIWDHSYKVGNFHIETYDWHANWKSHLINDLKIHETAVEAAHKNGMEIFFYFGLFEHGVQPDVGIICPYIFEDILRIEHPEWCPLDRWGQRRAPGPLSFCYPEVRKLLVERYVNHVVQNDYDGINFYTYVENLGLRYLHEFGFEQPILDAFKQKYPEIDLRKDTLALTPEQKEYWYYCRGLFVTQFLRELRVGLTAQGKKLSMILDAKNPDYVQPWWGHDMPGTGMIHLDWQKWIDEGLVDEFWVQLSESENQKKTLDLLLEKCKGKPIKLTLRTPSPFDTQWIPYVEEGVTPIAVITWARNGIERYSLEPTSIQTLQSPDWKLRGQTLDDIAQGKLKADAASVMPLAKDPQVLVRRKAMHALKALADPQSVETIEEALTDAESSVRIAAADALAKINGPQTPQRIIAALEKNCRFQFKIPCIQALGAMQERSLPVLLQVINHPIAGIREVGIRGLYKLGKAGMIEQVYPPLRQVMLKGQEGYPNRCWAVERLVGLRMEMTDPQRQEFTQDLNELLHEDSSRILQLHAAQGLGYMAALLSADQKAVALDNLQKMYTTYGDGCQREDAAYGWREVGNALIKFGVSGRDRLEAMRSQTDDKWLAWIAYETLYLEQKNNGNKFCVIEEKQAIENQEKYAPAFPGWRKW